jgi:hypothetical protein
MANLNPLACGSPNFSAAIRRINSNSDQEYKGSVHQRERNVPEWNLQGPSERIHDQLRLPTGLLSAVGVFSRCVFGTDAPAQL